MTWIEALREEYRPQHIRVLFVGESPPDPRDAEQRFFYSPTLFAADNLFRGLMLAIYDAEASQLTGAKPAWLDRFRSDGFWLIDLTDRPVNGLAARHRRQACADAVPGAVRRIRGAAPTAGVVICHTPTYNLLHDHLEQGVGDLLHDASIPFPLGNHRARFADLVRTAMRSAGIAAPM